MSETLTFAIIAGAVCLFVLVILGIGLVAMLPAVGILGGLGYLFNSQAKKSKALKKAALSWPSVPGTVQTSRVEVSGGEYTTVYPHIEYEYTVAAQKYRYDSIKAGDKFVSLSFTQSNAYEVVEKYPVGTRVRVYYNPDNPAEATLER
jgi:hypothetical protein